jgi:hypothetical protein
MKGTLKLKLAVLAVILAAAVLVPAVQAAEVHAILTSDNDGTDTPFVGPVTGQPGDMNIFSFYVKVWVTGTPNGGPSGTTYYFTVCNNITLNADGTFVCNSTHMFNLVKGHNYSTGGGTPDTTNSFPSYVAVMLNIAEDVDCPASFDLLERLAASSNGVDFGEVNGVKIKMLELPFDVEVECAAWQGCSHGYWKNHTQSWEVWSSSDTVGDPFDAGTLDSLTLLQAMQFTGPGNTVEDAKRILLQQAVASLLNAEHSGVNFPMDPDSLIAAVNAQLDSSDRAAILALKDELDAKNNLGCPLN